MPPPGRKVMRDPARAAYSLKRRQRAGQSATPPDVRMRSICGEAERLVYCGQRIGDAVEGAMEGDRERRRG